MHFMKPMKPQLSQYIQFLVAFSPPLNLSFFQSLQSNLSQTKSLLFSKNTIPSQAVSLRQPQPTCRDGLVVPAAPRTVPWKLCPAPAHAYAKNETDKQQRRRVSLGVSIQPWSLVHRSGIGNPALTRSAPGSGNVSLFSNVPSEVVMNKGLP
jgi:hypothetical protein